MKISEAIAALKACLEQFGDVPCNFTSTAEGNPAIELQNVDTTKSDEDMLLEEILRFNARFPIKNLFENSRN